MVHCMCVTWCKLMAMGMTMWLRMLHCMCAIWCKWMAHGMTMNKNVTLHVCDMVDGHAVVCLYMIMYDYVYLY